MYPAGLTITPDPRPVCGRACSPKKNWNQGSPACGLRAVLLVLMLTTAGEAMRAALLRLLLATSAGRSVSICSNTGTMEVKVGGRASHWGLRVATTKYSASSTVTDWANNNQ